MATLHPDLITASDTSINPSVRGSNAGIVDGIELEIIAFMQVSRVFIDRHRGLPRARNFCNQI